MQLSFAEICRLILCHPVDSAICRAILIWINQFGIHVIIPAQALTAPVTEIHIFTFHCHMAFGTNRITCFVRENHDLFYWHLQPIASKHPKHSSAGAHFWPYWYLHSTFDFPFTSRLHRPSSSGSHTSYHGDNLPLYDSGPFWLSPHCFLAMVKAISEFVSSYPIASEHPYIILTLKSGKFGERMAKKVDICFFVRAGICYLQKSAAERHLHGVLATLCRNVSDTSPH